VDDRQKLEVCDRYGFAVSKRLSCTCSSPATISKKCSGMILVENPTDDGNFALRKALRAENFALAEYHRVLTIFTDLVLRGKIPDAAPKVDGDK
jgi:hypothetical protein